MPSDMEKFQADFLESVRQMKRCEAARVTTVPLSKEPGENRIEVLDMKTEYNFSNMPSQPNPYASQLKNEMTREDSEVELPAFPLSRDPEIMGGALVFSDTRVPVKNLFDYLEGGESLDVFLDNFPTVTNEQAVSALQWAYRLISKRELTP